MMIVVTWLAQCLLIAAVLAAAATFWEMSARWSGRPARWGWLGALAGSVTLPWLLRLLPEPAALPTISMSVPVLTLEPISVGASLMGPGWSAVDMALAGWAALSVLAVAYVFYLVGHLSRARLRWHRTMVDGERVYVTRNTGPAALGVRDAMVIIPAWVLNLDGELRALLLQHEREHVKAGDPKVLLAGLMLLATMPWNPVLWLQFLRLRNAIELDCDGRVLARGADPERYGSLLLEVGRRRAGSALIMATFAEPRVFLRERIRRIATWPLERRRGRAWSFGLLAVVLCATALNARDPLRPRVSDAASATTGTANATQDHGVLPADTPAGPFFTPMTVAPELQNRDEVLAALTASYPPMLRDAGIGGRPTVWFFIDTDGVVQSTKLSQSSGHALLDEAALSVASVMTFSPALNGDRRVEVWVELPIIFKAPGTTVAPLDRRPEPVVRPTPADAAEQPGRDQPQPLRRPQPEPPPRAAGAAGAPGAAGAGASASPYFTPMTVAPELANRMVVNRALQESYPPMLRDAGIGGRTLVWFFINRDGIVESTRVSETSGHAALDDAALRVGSAMVFTPALNRGEPVAVWVELPIVFTAR